MSEFMSRSFEQILLLQKGVAAGQGLYTAFPRPSQNAIVKQSMHNISVNLRTWNGIDNIRNRMVACLHQLELTRQRDN